MDAIAAAAVTGSAGLNIESLVSTEPTWKDVLVSLVRENKVDPWNIDIVDIVDKYIEHVKRMKILDLRLPANIILAASILLRLKSEMLVIEEQAYQEEEREERIRQNVNVDSLVFRLRLPPRRRVTLAELMSALDEAMKLKENRMQSQKQEPFQLPMKFDKIDINAEADYIYGALKKRAGKEGLLTFLDAMDTIKTDDVLLRLFIPLLFLHHKERIDLMQEVFLGEIVIRLN